MTLQKRQWHSLVSLNFTVNPSGKNVALGHVSGPGHSIGNAQSDSGAIPPICCFTRLPLRDGKPHHVRLLPAENDAGLERPNAVFSMARGIAR